MYRAAAPADPAPLKHRIEQALADAVAVTRRSVLLWRASQHRREGGLTTRCAWCGRYAVGDTFPEPEETPEFVRFTPASQVTHGICPECVEQLKREGKSR